jgi:flagellar hook assembly protein FlgD
VVRAVPSVALQAGAQSLTWDGRLPRGSKAYGGAYVAHLVVASDVGTSDITAPFAFTRVAR